MRCFLLIAVMGMAGFVRARYAPTRDQPSPKDWFSLTSEQQQQHLNDVKILSSFLKQHPDFFAENQEHHGFDSSERDFDGFQHPFFYVSNQQRDIQEVEEPRGPFVFSRIGGEGPVDPNKGILVDLPFRHRRLGNSASKSKDSSHAGGVMSDSA